MPSLQAADIFSANLAGKEGEFPGGNLSSGFQKNIAAAFARLGGDKWTSQANTYVGPDGKIHANDPAGVGVVQGSLPYSQWTPEMKKAFAPQLAFNPTDMGLGSDISTSLGENY